MAELNPGDPNVGCGKGCVKKTSLTSLSRIFRYYRYTRLPRTSVYVLAQVSDRDGFTLLRLGCERDDFGSVLGEKSRIVEFDRTFGIDGLELHLVSLSPAHRSEHEYRGAVRNGGAQAVEKSNILTIHEEVDVAPHVPTLVHDPVERSR